MTVVGEWLQLTTESVWTQSLWFQPFNRRIITSMQFRPINFKVGEKAAKIWNEDPTDINFVHSVFTQCSLPYKAIKDPAYITQNGLASLKVTSGFSMGPEGSPVAIGVPYGVRPRLVLIHAMTEAVKRQDRNIPISDNFSAYLRNDLGANTDTRTMRSYREQIKRLAQASITIDFTDPQAGRQVIANTTPFSRLELWGHGDANQRELWPSEVTLSHEFFESLCAHAVPLDQRAISNLKHNARALDLYVWLAHRLHRVRQPKGQFISWEALAMQFGGSMKVETKLQLKDFSRELWDALMLALQNYPKAKVEKVRGGLKLYNSPTPIRTISAQVVRLPSEG